MAKAQHVPAYRAVPTLLRKLREDAALSQRELGTKMKRPQSWIYNCETANRRVDVTEFVAWCRACAVDPLAAMSDLLKSGR